MYTMCNVEYTQTALNKTRCRCLLQIQRTVNIKIIIMILKPQQINDFDDDFFSKKYRFYFKEKAKKTLFIPFYEYLYFGASEKR